MMRSAFLRDCLFPSPALCVCALRVPRPAINLNPLRVYFASVRFLGATFVGRARRVLAAANRPRCYPARHFAHTARGPQDFPGPRHAGESGWLGSFTHCTASHMTVGARAFVRRNCPREAGLSSCLSNKHTTSCTCEEVATAHHLQFTRGCFKCFKCCLCPESSGKSP